MENLSFENEFRFHLNELESEKISVHQYSF